MDEEHADEGANLDLTTNCEKLTDRGNESRVSAPVSDQDLDGDIHLTDDPKETCIFICAICGRPMTNFRGHLINAHALSVKQYKLLHPNDVFQRKTYHRYLLVVPIKKISTVPILFFLILNCHLKINAIYLRK